MMRRMQADRLFSSRHRRIRRPGHFIGHLVGVLLALCTVLPGGGADAAWPPDESRGKVDYSLKENWPNDPGYPGMWEMWSFAPQNLTQLDERSKRLGTGGHYDQAWARTPGDPRVLIAELDSGIYWNSPDLVNKFFLNRGELPPPDDGCQSPDHHGDNRVHDANGDGIFNVQDYTRATGHQQPVFAKVCDTRLKLKGDVNGNGILDPQDLIAAFSDGKDDDGNGYVDDIAGWDFFHNDNDPADDVHYGHGTGEAHDSAGEGDNGIGDIGVCPRCMVMPLRVGDSFIADASAFGMAATYAVDIGASVIQEALGALDNTPISRYAIDYAYDNHVTVIASAADENSFHHNFPGTNNHTIYVHAIRYNADTLDNATDVFAFNNCTNYGAQLLLSVPGTSCSSEATGKAAGLAGLLYSAALLADLPAPPPIHARGLSDAPAGDPGPAKARVRRITAEEVKQLLTGTADHFYSPTEDHTLSAFPTGPGFVRRFGYGRPNGRSAVDRIFSGALPPEAEIESPEWFQVLYTSQGQVPVKGRISLRTPGDSFDYLLEWAPGVDATDDRFQAIGHGEMLNQGMEGTLGSFVVKDLRIDNPVPARDDPAFQPDDPAHVHTVTLRLRVTLHSTDPGRNGLVGEARRAVHVITDPDLLPGFPIRLGASGESSIKTADLLGDGRRELILGDAGGLVHAITASGTELPGWPVQGPALPALADGPSGHGRAPAWLPATGQDQIRQRPPGLSPILSTPAVGDLNGDGKPEVVVATYYGAVLALSAQGKLLPGFPVHSMGDAGKAAIDPRHTFDDGFFAAPVLVDLDRDGKLDIVAASMDGRVYAWHGDGSPVAGWPVQVWDLSKPDDGKQKDPRQQARIMGTPAVGDLNGDGIPDVAVSTNEQYDDGTGRLYVIDGRGNRASSVFLPGWPVHVQTQYVLPVVGLGLPNAVALGDIDGDGVPEVFTSGIAGAMKVFKANGQPIAQQPIFGRSGFGNGSEANEIATVPVISSPALGDIDDDGKLDLIMPTAGISVALGMAKGWARSDYEMHISAWDLATGYQKVGFPTLIEDWLFFVNPILADVDGDGMEDVVAGSAGYFVHAWNAAGKEARGFPKFTGGWNAASPAVGDLDGDGRLELAINTRDGWLFAWHIGGRTSDRIDWESFHHDNRNTGNAGVKLDQGGHPARLSGGCSISGSGSGAGGPRHPMSRVLLGGLFLLALALFLRHRRLS